jgi:hypothetical protein
MGSVSGCVGAKGMSALVKPVDSNSANTGHREPPGAMVHRAKIEFHIP